MARPVFGRSEAPRRPGGAGVVRLDRDRALVEAARRDPYQFEALYRKYVAQVYGYALYELGNHHDAEDATEQAFLAALSGLRRFREQATAADGDDASTFRIWLFRIARNVVSNQRRTARRHPTLPLDAVLDRPGTDDPEGAAVDRGAAEAAWRAVAALPDDRRRAVILRFVHEMTTAEIAGVLGRSEGAVRVLLHRALRAVARDLRERDG